MSTIGLEQSSVDHEGNSEQAVSLAFSIVAMGIFLVVSITFIFPSNYIIPFDRRSIAVIGATLCYITRTFIFSGNLNLIEAVDFDVLVLLASIMAINHMIVHLDETRRVIQRFQRQILDNPERGFWILSLVVFVSSPFLTNDGVCLLFVDIIVDTFESIANCSSNNQVVSHEAKQPASTDKLQRSDVVYFLITLACSSNIGSALTYTGNPQNMIVGQDAISVMSPISFLGYMLLPATISWMISMLRH